MTAVESPTILDIQGHTFLNYKLEKLISGPKCCLSFYWLNLIMTYSFLFIFLKAMGKWTKSSPTTLPVALMKVIFPKIIKHWLIYTPCP